VRKKSGANFSPKNMEKENGKITEWRRNLLGRVTRPRKQCLNVESAQNFAAWYIDKQRESSLACWTTGQCEAEWAGATPSELCSSFSSDLAPRGEAFRDIARKILPGRGH